MTTSGYPMRAVHVHLAPRPPRRSLAFLSVPTIVAAVAIFLSLSDRASAQGCTFTVTPTTLNVPAAGATGTLTVAASSATCDWSATSSAPWAGVSATSVGGYDAVVLADNPAAYWRFNDTTRPTARDSSGHGYHGSYYYSYATLGQPGAVAGDSAIGGMPIVNLPNTPAMNGAGTVELWVKPNGSPSEWYSRWTGGAGWEDLRIRLYSQAGDNRIHAMFADGTSAQMDIASTSDLPLNAWSHIVLEWNGSYWLLYRNGVFDAWGYQTVVPYTGGVPAYVGGFSPYANGGVDELAVYPFMLADARIAAHYAARTKAAAGNGTVTYTIPENTSPGARGTTLTIAGQTVTVTQADPCAIAATDTSAASGSSSGTINVTGTSACHWTTSSGAAWISLETAAARYADRVVADGAAAYWRLNETSGTAAHDSSGHNYHGTYGGWPTYGQTGGVAGDTAVGGTPIVSMPMTPSMSTSGTVELWVKPTGATSYWYTRWYGGQAWADMRISLYSQAGDNKIHGVFADGTNAQLDVASASDLPLNVWTHVALTWNGSYWWLYLNGAGNAYGAQTVVPFTNAVPAYFGQPYPYANGGIDDVAEYPTALSPQQIANHVALATAAAYTGNGSLTFTLTANPTTTARTGTVTIGDQTFSVTQDGQPIPCTYALSTASLTLDAAGGAGAVALTTAASCGWTAASDAGWLTVTPASGTSNAAIAYVAANNATASTRTATITVGKQTVTVTQTPCSFTFTPGSLSLAAGGGSGSVGIAAPSTCGWNATASDPWVTLFPSIGGYADQVVADGAAAYWRLNEASGSTVADSSGHGHAGTINAPSWDQFGQPGGVVGDTAVTGTSPIDLGVLPATDGTGTIEVWVKPTGAQSHWFTRWYGGQGWVDLRVLVYSQPSDNKLHVVFADGTNAQLNIASTSDVALNTWTHVVLTWADGTWHIYLNGVADSGGAQTVTPFTTGVPGYIGQPSPYINGGVDDVAVYTAALSSQQIASHYAVGRSLPPTGVGNGSIRYAAAPNPGSLARTGTIAVGAQTASVTQDGQPCTYSVSPPTLTLTGEAQSGVLALTTPGACTWTATSTVGWITFPAANGISAASIAYAVAANPGADRSGTMTLGGQTVTVLQRAVCTYSYTPLSATVSATAGVSTIAVTSSAPTCAWTAGTSTPWLAMTAAGGYAGTVLGDRPVGYWRLGELATNVPAHDEVGGHDGAYVGPVVVGQPGLVAGSDTATFFGDSAWVDLGWQVPSTDAAGSVEFWTTPSGRGPLVVRSSGTTWGDQRVAVYTDWMDTKYHVAFADTQHAQTDIVSASDVTFNTPTHVVVTWGQGAWAIYLNGVLDATGPLTVVPYTWGSTTYVGYGPGLTYGYAHATLDEVALYDHALPASAVATHYAARTSLPLLGSGVIAYRRDANQTLTARTGSMLIEDDIVPITQSGLAPLLDINGTVPPTTVTVAPGATVAARVRSGPGNLRDWVGLYAAGSDDAAGPLAWAYLSGTTDAPPTGLTTATVALPMPMTPGTYEVRFFWNDALFRLATSGPVMVGGPTVSITSPTAGATFGAGETVTVTAYASDYGPGVSRVDFAVNGTVVTSATAPPWTGAWGTATNGTYALTAVATDASGFVATSSAVTITVAGGSSGGGSGGGSSGGGGGVSCPAAVSPATQAVGAEGLTAAVAITASPGCGWSATSQAGWIAVTATGAGDGIVQYTVAANSSSSSRTGRVVVGARMIDIMQAGAGQTGCPQPNGNDTEDDTAAIQCLLDQGGTVTLDADVLHGYIISNPGLTLRRNGTTLTSTSAWSYRALLLAAPTLTAPILQVESGAVSGYTIEKIWFDGNRFNRPCDHTQEKHENVNVRLRGGPFIVDNLESDQAVCVSGMIVDETTHDFWITNSWFAYNGFPQSNPGHDAGDQEERWSDGLTVHACVDGHVVGNHFLDNTDVDLIFGGTRREELGHPAAECQVVGNQVAHFATYGYAGLMLTDFSATLLTADHTGAEYASNTITAATGTLSFGIMIGHHPWNPQVWLTGAGNVHDNSAAGANVNLAVDGAQAGSIQSNAASAPQGVSGFHCTAAGNDYTAFDFGATELQPGFVPRRLHPDDCTSR